MLSLLSKLLDPPTAEEHDWRLLAKTLNVHRYVTFFETTSSLTKAILEARNRNLGLVMDCFDTAAVIEWLIH